MTQHPSARTSPPGRVLIGILTGALALALVACGGDSTTTTAATSGGGGSSDSASVTIDNFAFSPASLTVATGATVTWTNNQTANHTVTGDAGEFDSAQLPDGASFSQTFDTAGTFAYHCEIHPNMTGTVTVEG